MSDRSDVRTAMAIPAILLFLVTCLAQIIAGVRGGTVLRGSGVDNNSGDGSEIEVTIKVEPDDVEDRISLERHHGHSHHNGKYNQPASHNAGQEDDSSFDFYVYSMSYQPEFCRENNERFAGCHKFRESWEGQLTIHGLWPNREDGTWPSTCTSKQLDTSQLTDLSDDLDQKWPNIKALSTTSSGHESFWAHEWSKHGTCSGLTQQEYFGTALSLMLPTPSIVKGNYGSTVKRTDLGEGYSGDNGQAAVFVCNSEYLSEVRVCFGKGGGGAVGDRVDCPATIMKEESCGDDIKIASFGTGRVVVAAE